MSRYHAFILMTFVIVCTASRRVVLTFEDASTIQDEQLYSTTDVTVVKRYGRRMLLTVPDDYIPPPDDRLLYTEEDLLVSARSDVVTGDMLDIMTTEAGTGLDLPISSDLALLGAAVDVSAPLTISQWNLMNMGLGVLANYTANTNVTVAVLDTGFSDYAVGYDFISDPDVAGDGDGRDPYASDPGAGNAPCVASWHGSKMANLIRGSLQDGYEGVAPGVALASIRVLGSCSKGYASDVADGIVWASGGTIRGMDSNPNPALVISMSFSGKGSCPSYLQSAVTQAVNTGIILFAAAGNNGRPLKDYFPGNCVGVQPVAASTYDDRIASYSNWGPDAVFAPGGSPTTKMIPLLVDNGTDTWIEEGAGTSLATAQAAGLAARFVTLGSPVRWIHPQKWVRPLSIAMDTDTCAGGSPGDSNFYGNVRYGSTCGFGVLDTVYATSSYTSMTNGTYSLARGPDDIKEWEMLPFLPNQDQLQASSSRWDQFCPSGRFVVWVKLYYHSASSSTNNIEFVCKEKWPGTQSTTLYLTQNMVNNYDSNAEMTMSSSGGFNGMEYCFNSGHVSAVDMYYGSTAIKTQTSWACTPPAPTGWCQAGQFISGFWFAGVANSGTLMDSLGFYCASVTGCGQYCPANKYVTDYTCNVGRDYTYTDCPGNCPYSQYRSGCGNTNYGSCTNCYSSCGDGLYNNGCSGISGGQCTSCPTTCATGKYNTGCSGLTSGSCVDCTKKPLYSSYTGNGGTTDSCTWGCDTGYVPNADSSLCVCPAGMSGSPCVSCVAGYYKSTVDLAACTLVRDCGVGKYMTATTGCTTPDCTCQTCTSGTYCTTAAQSNALGPTTCPAGSYCNSTGMTAPRPCPAGSFCPTVGTVVPYTCPAGNYCPSGSDAVTQCPPGSMCNTTGMSVPLPCPAGSFCPAGTVIPSTCTAGNYCPNASMTTQISCPAGSYCPSNGTSVPLACPAGSICPLPGTVIPSTCTAGNYCPTGSAALTQCPPGSICPSNGMPAPTPCPAGWYCRDAGATAKYAMCQEKYYCPTGSVAPLSCPKGSYCPDVDMAAPSLCQPGTYCPGTRLTVPSDCPSGSYCPSTNMSAPLLCPAGSYCNSVGLSAALSCHAGKYCPEGSSAEISCNTGRYCPNPGMSAQILCDPGSYCPNTSTTTQTSCPIGSYCLAGSSAATLCEVGYYCPNAGMSTHTLCQAGWYCPDPGASTVSANCLPGSYCPAGSSAPTLCEVGHFCPSSGMASQTSCTIGNFCPSPGASAPTPCTAGGGCLTGGMSAPVFCSTGSYCPRGSSKAILCPVGSYCPTGSETPTQCTAGWYCPYTGASAVSNRCTVGSYCPVGSNSTTLCMEGYYCPSTGMSAPTLCPAGNYCPVGSVGPIPCPRGENSPSGSSNSTACTAPSAQNTQATNQTTTPPPDTPPPASSLDTTATIGTVVGVAAAVTVGIGGTVFAISKYLQAATMVKGAAQASFKTYPSRILYHKISIFNTVPYTSHDSNEDHP